MFFLSPEIDRFFGNWQHSDARAGQNFFSETEWPKLNYNQTYNFMTVLYVSSSIPHNKDRLYLPFYLKV